MARPARRAYHVRNQDDPNEVITVGFFDGTAEDIDAMRDDPQWMAGEERRLRRIAPLEEAVRLAGVYEVVDEIVPELVGSGQHVARPVARLPLRHRRLDAGPRDEARALDQLVAVDVARAVREHLARPDADDEQRARPARRQLVVRVDRSPSPFRRSRRWRSNEMNSSPTSALTSTLPADRNMPLPS